MSSLFYEVCQIAVEDWNNLQSIAFEFTLERIDFEFRTNN